MPERSTATLVDLVDTELTLANPADDVRNRTVVDRDGHEIGGVKSILIDDRERQVRFLEVESGGFLGIGGETRLVPVDAITDVTEHEVRIDKTRDYVHDAPRYDPELTRERHWDDDFYRGVYDYYGYTPWAAGYPLYPRYR